MYPAQVSLEFYQKRKKWPFTVENIPWEVWTVKTELISFANEQERQRYQEALGEILADKVQCLHPCFKGVVGVGKSRMTDRHVQISTSQVKNVGHSLMLGLSHLLL